jgi:8-oxo-dGTP diphosphatase
MRAAGGTLRTEKATSAGGVVYGRDHDTGAIEVVLCRRDREDLWALPKGTPLPGESLRETALREVREETGIGVMIEGELGTSQHEFVRAGVRYQKTVHYFLLSPDGTGATSEHDAEYDRVEWMRADDAMRLLTWQNERNALQRAIEAIDAGTGVTA